MQKGTEKRAHLSDDDLEKLKLIYWEQDFWIGYRRGLNRLQHGKVFASDEEHRSWLDMSDNLHGGLSIHRVAEGIGYRAGYAGLDVNAAAEKMSEFIKSFQEKYGSKTG